MHSRMLLPTLTVDAPMRPVGAPALLLCLVDLDVGDLQGISVETLHLQHRHGTGQVPAYDGASTSPAAQS